MHPVHPYRLDQTANTQPYYTPRYVPDFALQFPYLPPHVVVVAPFSGIVSMQPPPVAGFVQQLRPTHRMQPNTGWIHKQINDFIKKSPSNLTTMLNDWESIQSKAIEVGRLSAVETVYLQTLLHTQQEDYIIRALYLAATRFRTLKDSVKKAAFVTIRQMKNTQWSDTFQRAVKGFCAEAAVSGNDQYDLYKFLRALPTDKAVTLIPQLREQPGKSPLNTFTDTQRHKLATSCAKAAVQNNDAKTAQYFINWMPKNSRINDNLKTQIIEKINIYLKNEPMTLEHLNGATQWFELCCQIEPGYASSILHDLLTKAWAANSESTHPLILQLYASGQKYNVLLAETTHQHWNCYRCANLRLHLDPTADLREKTSQLEPVRQHANYNKHRQAKTVIDAHKLFFQRAIDWAFFKKNPQPIRDYLNNHWIPLMTTTCHTPARPMMINATCQIIKSSLYMPDCISATESLLSKGQTLSNPELTDLVYQSVRKTDKLKTLPADIHDVTFPQAVKMLNSQQKELSSTARQLSDNLRDYLRDPLLCLRTGLFPSPDPAAE